MTLPLGSIDRSDGVALASETMLHTAAWLKSTATLVTPVTFPARHILWGWTYYIEVPFSGGSGPFQMDVGTNLDSAAYGNFVDVSAAAGSRFHYTPSHLPPSGGLQVGSYVNASRQLRIAYKGSGPTVGQVLVVAHWMQVPAP